MNLYKTLFQKDKLLYFATCLFSFSLCFEPHWSSKAFIFLIITSFLNIDISISLAIKSNYIKILFILILYSTINMVIIGDGFDDKSYSIIGLCILFYLIFSKNSFRKININYILFSFLLGVLVVGLVNITNIVGQLMLDDFSLFNSWESYSIIDIQKIYYALYLNMAYVILLYFLQEKVLTIRVYLLCLPLVGLLLFVTGAVSGFLVFILINILFGVKVLFPLYFAKFSILALVFPLVLLFLMSFNNTQSIFQKLDGDGSRLRNYKTNIGIILEKPILGHGIGVEMRAMQDARDINSWERKEAYNAHNQYFEILIGGGFVYLFLLLSLLGILLFNSIRLNSKFNWLTISFNLILFYVFIIESLLVRHHGFMFFSFFLSLLWYLESSSANCNTI